MKKKIILSITIAFISSIILTFLSFSLFNNIYINKPNYIEIRNSNEETISTYNHNYEGGYVELKDISTCFIETLINTEDKNFYNHKGFDYKRIGKSIIDNISSNSLSQGASTITQQLAKNLYLSNEKTWNRKIKEAFLTIKIENQYTKNYILELYINNIYFAHNLYGLKIASDYYFHKEPSQLNYQESCLLVGIINAPNLYSPFIDEKASLKKQKDIAFNLYKNNIITINEYHTIIRTKLQLYGYLSNNQNNNAYYFQGISRQINKLNLYNKNDTEQGLIINTYFDKDIQNIVEKNIKKYDFEDQISVIIMKPFSNQVISLIGGKDFSKSEYNRALDSYRQIGSTIKPFIYYLSLCSGLTPLTKFESKPTTFTLEDGTTYSPKNSNEIYANRKITMVEALAMSDNIYAVKASLIIGTNQIKNLLNQLGANIREHTLAISLGGVEMTPLQLAGVYNTLASEGIYYEPSFIKEVKRTDGTTIYKDKQTKKSLLKYDETMIINHLLKSPFDNGLITYSSPTMKSYKTKNIFACKTGTTKSSSWTVGYNKDYTLLVYVGDDNNLTLHDTTISKKIFRDIANEITINKKDNFYSYPSNLKTFKFHNPIYSTYSFEYIKQKN